VNGKKEIKMMPENIIGAAVSVSNEDEKALEKCIAFLKGIGINVIYRTIPANTFLPGLSIEGGCIIIDREKLLYPGDILHEAAHIAIVPAAERAGLDAASIATRPDNQAEEMMAIAWSYAACVYLQMDPYFVFHDNGYKGGGSYIADNFKEKRYFGLPMLQWKGMAVDEKNAAIQGIKPYPFMIRWMLD
jgi:hypothetical protein